MSVALMAPASFPQVRVCSKITGTGMWVPERVVGNDHFAAYLDTSDEWIRERTGISERRWARADESASSLAEPAARQAISRAGLEPDAIDGIIFATVTPDAIFPSSACYLQKRLGIRGGLAFDLNAACSGFVYGLSIADGLIASGQARNILVVGSELYSRIINPNDRTTCVLFGDGAGAVVLSAAVAAQGAAQGRNYMTGSAGELSGIYAYQLGADGTQADILNVPSGTAFQPTADSLQAGKHFLQMEGREVFKLAVRKLEEISNALLEQVGIPATEVDYFVSHQANQRILLSMADKLGVPHEKVLSNVARYGNTSAASLPILIAEAEAEGTLKAGDLLLVTAFGGGVTWGALLIRL